MAAADRCRIFFATDIHGSELCYRKFLNAAEFYGANCLILGGDITGKALIPIIQHGDSWNVQYGDHLYEQLTRGQAEAVAQKIRDRGQYPVFGDSDEVASLADEENRNKVFREVVVESIARWVELAEARLAGSGVRCFITPGNDDFWDIDAVLRGSKVVEFVEGSCVYIDDVHQMITTGYSNPTPWESPRELPEDDLQEYLERMWESVSDADNLVSVFHAPPQDTTLDQAPVIDGDFRVQFEGGSLRMAGVGSLAVRRFIERHQPLCALHGHVHESRGIQLMGRTLCINPGSEYGDGTLLGALVTLSRGRVMGHQLVAG